MRYSKHFFYPLFLRVTFFRERERTIIYINIKMFIQYSCLFYLYLVLFKKCVFSVICFKSLSLLCLCLYLSFSFHMLEPFVITIPGERLIWRLWISGPVSRIFRDQLSRIYSGIGFRGFFAGLNPFPRASLGGWKRTPLVFRGSKGWEKNWYF